jgi:ubiquinone/menaquinone biosynthesis C-methylase UbiE
MPFSDSSFDAVICSAVLHFADDAAHFDTMVAESWRLLAPGGLFFARLASNIGLESIIGPGGRRVRLPDGSDRFVVDEALLLTLTARLGGRLADPLKTTVVQGMRAMTTWCMTRGD